MSGAVELPVMTVPLGTKSNPIRCSKLSAIVRCSMRIYLLMIYENDDSEGGPAAQIGSLTHAGVAEFHRVNGPLLKRKKAAWDAIKAHAGMFPLADETEVRLFLTPYMEDPRNIHAEFCTDAAGLPLIEYEVKFTLPPHELDVSQEPIYVEGHLDQVRKVNSIPTVCDYKTGKKTGWEMIHDHALQIAAYTYGVREHIGLKTAQPGPIIRGYGYRSKDAIGDSPDGVFFNNPLRWNDVEELLSLVRLHVALLRNGHVHYGPGPHCTFCEFGGLTGCTDHYKKTQGQ